MTIIVQDLGVIFKEVQCIVDIQKFQEWTWKGDMKIKQNP